MPPRGRPPPRPRLRHGLRAHGRAALADPHADADPDLPALQRAAHGPRRPRPRGRPRPRLKPAPTGGVVIAANSGDLADEGKLIAGELGIPYRGAVAAGPGDVELALGGTGAPESYTLAVQGGRVRISGPDEAGVFYGTRTSSSR